MSLFTPHSIKQQELILSEADETVAITGTQWGKSQGGTLWVQKQTCEFNDKKDNFLIAAPTYKILQQSIIPYFLYHFQGFGEYNKSESVFRIKQAGTVYFRTETDPDSIVGIPNVRAGWLDEAGKLRRYFYDNYRARAAAKGARTLITTSPYSLNWLYTDKVKPKLAGKFPDLKLIQAASWENPFHTLHDPKKREQLKATMDSRRFDMIFGGQFGKMIGLVYDCFEESMHVVPQVALPPGTTYYGGIDWGYTDPFVLGVRAITPTGHHFRVSEFYKTGMTLPEMITVAKQKMSIFGIKKFFAGPDQPGYIEEFNRNGLPTEGAENDIRKGIDLHYQLIKQGLYKVFAGTSPHCTDEYSTYHYPEPEELAHDQDSKEQNPVGQNDHCMDQERYITVMTYRSQEKHTPKTPTENKKLSSMDQEKRLEYLKRKNRLNRGSENWS